MRQAESKGKQNAIARTSTRTGMGATFLFRKSRAARFEFADASIPLQPKPFRRIQFLEGILRSIQGYMPWSPFEKAIFY
jgi:hypothetical protein